MKRKYINRTGMAATVADYMNKNNTVWTGNKAVSDTMTQLNTALTGVNQKAQDQETPIAGEEVLKISVRHDYEEEIMRIAGQICSLAAKSNDPNLAAESELTLSQLDKMDVDTLEETGTRISGLATANLTGLADYNITQTDVTGLNTMTTQFHGVKTAPRTAIAKRAGKTANLQPAVKTVTSLLRNNLDKEMLMFKKSNPDFYAGYVAARVIVDRGGRTATPQPAPTPAPQTTTTK
jgi:hypothetical protein